MPTRIKSSARRNGKQTVAKPKVAHVIRKTAKPKVPRITYATLSITPKDDEAYDSAVVKVRGQLGTHFTNFINGEACPAREGETAHASPVDTRLVVSYFPKGTRQDARAAIQAARDAYKNWSAMD